RQKELTLLNEAWESDTTNIVSFVAYGGVGKSTLINKWVEKIRWDNYRGAEKVYAWSFYSQGTKEQVTSADMFISNALKWFGDENPEKGSPWDKGKRLAKLINNHKTLLILDGLEPLQAGAKVEKGKIKDPALETLIKELAKNNKGLCIITTREHVPELDRYTKKTKQENLEHISDEAGRKLLETRRIFGSEKELERIVQQFGNHALAINLLAEYLRMFENHPLE
ncbi:MAG: NACHT domain-containing protein, partial [Candidatus Scalindua sp.]